MTLLGLLDGGILFTEKTQGERQIWEDDSIVCGTYETFKWKCLIVKWMCGTADYLLSDSTDNTFLKRTKLQEPERVVARDQREREGITAKGQHEAGFGDDRPVFYPDCDRGNINSYMSVLLCVN